MTKFGFIAHPLNLNDIVNCSILSINVRKLISSYYLKAAMLHVNSYKLFKFSPIISGRKIEGLVVMCPLMPDQLVRYKTSVGIKRIVKACKIAENYGANIIGLGGFTSIITNNGTEIASKFNARLTSGNTYTTCLVVDGILKIVKERNLNLKNISLTIIGASGDIGSACARYLSKYFYNINLVGRNYSKIEAIKMDIVNNNKNISCFEDLDKVLPNSDIIIAATSSLTTIIDHNLLKNNAIVCDVSYPANINIKLANKRPDIFVYEGGMASHKFVKELKPKVRKKIEVFNSAKALHGCVCETMIMALDPTFSMKTANKGSITNNEIDTMRQKAEQFDFQCSV